MLLHVKYGYHVEAIPRRGRLARHMAFLDETAIEIPEISAAETEARLDVEEASFPGTTVGRWRIVAHGDRLFRPVPSGGVRPFDLDLWARMRAEGLAPDRENDTLGLAALVDEPPPRGEETIYGAGLYHSWPTHRIEEVPLRALIADHREADHARLQRNAARLLLIGGVLHVETSEPVWVADYRTKRLLIRGAREQIAQSSLVYWNKHPFAAYDPASAEFVETCGWCALSVRMIGRPVEPVLALYAACGREIVESFFARWPFLFAACAQGDEQYLTAVAAAVAADEKSLPEMLVGRVLLIHAPTDEAQRAREIAAMRVLLRRLRGVDLATRIDVEAMLWLASRMPPDWIPADGDEAVLFAFVAKAVRSLCIEADGGLSAATLISSAKGRWSDFYARLDGNPPDALQVADMWKAFCNQVARPALRHAGVQADEAALARRCAGLLFGAKALPAVVAVAAEWHRLRRDMDRAIGGGVDASWPAPFSRSEHGNVVLVAVVDSDDLEAEGAALRHCVGGYVDRCLNQTSVIVSVRRLLDGGEVRSSTVELSGWRYGWAWIPSVLQHRGPHNSEPPRADSAALAEFLRKFGAAPVVPRPAGEAAVGGDRPEADVHVDAVAAAARYDWRDGNKVEASFRQWARFLPADVAARGPRWFADHGDDFFASEHADETVR